MFSVWKSGNSPISSEDFFFPSCVEAVVIYHSNGSNFVAMAMMVFNPEPTGSRVLPETRLLFLLVCQENGCLSDITYKQLYFPPKAKVQRFSPRPPKYRIKPNPAPPLNLVLLGVTSGAILGNFGPLDIFRRNLFLSH